jgi:hypothetical protein
LKKFKTDYRNAPLTYAGLGQVRPLGSSRNGKERPLTGKPILCTKCGKSGGTLVVKGKLGKARSISNDFYTDMREYVHKGCQ